MMCPWSKNSCGRLIISTACLSVFDIVLNPWELDSSQYGRARLRSNVFQGTWLCLLYNKILIEMPSNSAATVLGSILIPQDEAFPADQTHRTLFGEPYFGGKLLDWNWHPQQPGNRKVKAGKVITGRCKGENPPLIGINKSDLYRTSIWKKCLNSFELR